jgi:hypothetical protein
VTHAQRKNWSSEARSKSAGNPYPVGYQSLGMHPKLCLGSQIIEALQALMQRIDIEGQLHLPIGKKLMLLPI